MTTKWRKLFNEEMETVTAKDLAALHEPKFLAQVKYVSEKSLFYQDKFKEAGLDVTRIRSLDDIVKLPFTVKSDLAGGADEEPTGWYTPSL